MRFCFLVSLLWGPEAVLFAAGDGGSTASAEPAHKVATVRADRLSGRLVRTTVVVPPRIVQPVAVRSAAPEHEPRAAEAKTSPATLVNEIVERAASRYDVDPLLVHSVIQVESAYNKYAVSSKGAQGLMQLAPSTARRLGVKNPFDPRENIEAGVRYLKQLQMMFKDDRLALAAYNAGEAAVSRHGWIPPYAETQNYVYQVGMRYGAANAARRAAERWKQQAETTQEPRKIEQFVDAEGRLHLRMR
ncbi:MAG: lytic transglycosylase domain-containing protein [Acidobacteria bacterium]|nr:lytic transglycosylase domain-containing protein [Acidobacteriota bacterium]